MRPAEGGVIEIIKGGEAARIAVLPWVPEFKIVDICKMMKPEDTWYQTYSENVVWSENSIWSSFQCVPAGSRWRWR